jgi:MFS family permease
VSSRSPSRRRDFRLLLAGQTASQLGAQVSGVAIPILAVLTLDASPLHLGLVTLAGTLGFALIGLPSGAWIDRRRRRPILIASDASRAVLLATIPMSLFPLGALLGGTLGQFLGLRATLWLSGAIIAVSALPVYRVLRRTRDVEEIATWAESREVPDAV